MAVITIGSSWSTGDQPTAAVLNAKWTNATFASGAVDDTTTALSGGAIIVKDLGVSTAKIANSAVTTAKIADANVTAAKLATTQDWSAFTITLPDDVVTTDIILDDAVTFAKVDTATQAEMEGESSAGVCVPDTVKYAPGMAKCYGLVTYDGAAAVTGGYNVSGVSDSATKTVRVTFTNAMADANYVVVVSLAQNNGRPAYVSARNAAYFEISHDDSKGSLSFFFTVFGSLA